MNLYQRGAIIMLRLWNISTKHLNGHYTVFYNLECNRFLLRQSGELRGLTYYLPTPCPAFEPDPAVQVELMPLIDRRLASAEAWEPEEALRFGKGRGGGYFVFPFDPKEHSPADVEGMDKARSLA